MASVHSEQVTPSTNNESFNEVFTPKNTLDQPCDVVLVVEGGKKFNAHGNVLSEASPFFEKLLNSDMKESQEGVVRLEMFSESVMAAALEFIYSRHVEILNEDNARDLIVMADYLLLEKLKSLAEGILAQKLNISNCISTYYFSERYQCEEVLSKTKKFILANFTAVYAANREDVLNMSSKEVEMWISSDAIDVRAEEDVFKFILAWIDHDKNKRKKYFAELFRHVRLVYVSRDFLSSDVVTSDLVKENEGCLDLVKDAMNLIDSKYFDNFSVPARKSLETPAIVITRGTELLCYFPGDDSWCRFGEIPKEIPHSRYVTVFVFFPCGGKLYGIRCYPCDMTDMVSYNPYSNSWTRLPPLEEDRRLLQIFFSDVKGMRALLSNKCPSCTRTVGPCDEEHSWFISTYKPESHSWEDKLSIDHFHRNASLEDYCIAASDQSIYFISRDDFTSGVYRNNLSEGQCEKVTDIQIARLGRAHGAAVNGKIFIAGGPQQCGMYDETTNKWQFIADMKKPSALVNLLAGADGKMYAVSSQYIERADLQQISIECYNPEKNTWEMKSEVVFPDRRVWFRYSTAVNAYSMGIFKGLCHIRPLETSSSDSFSETTTTKDSCFPYETGKRKCVVM